MYYGEIEDAHCIKTAKRAERMLFCYIVTHHGSHGKAVKSIACKKEVDLIKIAQRRVKESEWN